MSKKRFVQDIIVRSLPAHDKLAEAVRYAETLWDGLSQCGYGADKGEARAAKDHYQALGGRPKAFFDHFWRAFAHKADRDGAAMRWLQLGDKTDAEYGRIIAAAAKEATAPREPGQVRKMAQGWLHEKRYLDYETPAPDKQVAKYNEVTRISNELAAIRRLYESGRDEALLAQIAKLEAAVRAARAKP